MSVDTLMPSGNIAHDGQPFLRFKQDPVRMIRLLKFQARFGLKVDSDTRIALLECRHEILKSSSARILEELLRMLESGSAGSFVHLMTEHGLLQMILPVLGEFLETERGKRGLCFFAEVDTTFQEPSTPPLERAILVSCLLWPLFLKRMAMRFEGRGRHPHLGEIHQEAQSMIEEILHLLAYSEKTQDGSGIDFDLSIPFDTPGKKTLAKTSRSARSRLSSCPPVSYKSALLSSQDCNWSGKSGARRSPPLSPSVRKDAEEEHVND